MSRIRGKDTTPEKVVRSLLHRMGYRFRLHVRIPIAPSSRPSPTLGEKVPGGRLRGKRTPRAVSVDILLPKHKSAIFVHGCFWHRHRKCKNCTTPTNNRDFWVKKLEANAARDVTHRRSLRKQGWRVTVIWECEADDEQALAIKLRHLV